MFRTIDIVMFDSNLWQLTANREIAVDNFTKKCKMTQCFAVA